jgi:hypothetical protein
MRIGGAARHEQTLRRAWSGDEAHGLRRTSTPGHVEHLDAWRRRARLANPQFVGGLHVPDVVRPCRRRDGSQDGSVLRIDDGDGPLRAVQKKEHAAALVGVDTAHALEPTGLSAVGIVQHLDERAVRRASSCIACVAAPQRLGDPQDGGDGADVGLRSASAFVSRSPPYTDSR